MRHTCGSPKGFHPPGCRQQIPPGMTGDSCIQEEGCSKADERPCVLSTPTVWV